MPALFPISNMIHQYCDTGSQEGTVNTVHMQSEIPIHVIRVFAYQRCTTLLLHFAMTTYTATVVHSVDTNTQTATYTA